MAVRRRLRLLLAVTGAAVALVVPTQVAAGAAVPPTVTPTVTPTTTAASTGTPAGATPAWTVTDHLARDAGSAAVACRSPADCWAATGGELLQSTDTGGHWSDRGDLLPATVRGLGDVSCPTASRCLLTGFTAAGAVLLVLDGRTVVVHTVPGAASTALRLDCATATGCVATNGTTAFRTSDGGASWARATLPRAMAATSAISCAAGTSTCVVAGPLDDGREVAAVVRSRDGGATWTTLAMPAGHTRHTVIDDVDCPSASTCWVSGRTGSAGLVFPATAGAFGAPVALPAEVFEVASISCSSTSTCRGVGHDANFRQLDVRTTDATTWSSSPVPDFVSDPFDIACPTGTTCIAVGAGRTYHVVAGRWVAVPVRAALRKLVAVSCPNVAPCIGVGLDAAGRPVALTGAPGGWTELALPSAVDSPDAIDCATARVCTVLSTYRPHSILELPKRRAWRTTDAGGTWTLQGLPRQATGSNRAIACPTTSSCVAIGTGSTFQPDVLRTLDSGATWARVGAPTGANDTGDVSCASATACVVVGSRGFSTPPVAWRTSDLGGTFAAPVPITGGSRDFVAEVRCWSATCVADGLVDDVRVFVRSIDGGRTWAPAVPAPGGGAGLGGLTCSAAGRCAAAAGSSNHLVRPLASADGGATWGVGALPDRSTMGPIGCLGSRCFTVGTDARGLPVVISEPG